MLNAIATTIDEGMGVINSVEKMVDAYILLYQLMEQDSEHTTQDLNNLYAKILTENDKSRTDALDALSNASGMSYDAFAELLTSYGKEFEKVINQKERYGIDLTGFGTIRINNFKKFAGEMGWDINSPEYAKAYNDYADAMAELQN